MKKHKKIISVNKMQVQPPMVEPTAPPIRFLSHESVYCQGMSLIALNIMTCVCLALSTEKRQQNFLPNLVACNVAYMGMAIIHKRRNAELTKLVGFFSLALVGGFALCAGIVLYLAEGEFSQVGECALLSGMLRFQVDIINDIQIRKQSDISKFLGGYFSKYTSDFKYNHRSHASYFSLVALVLAKQVFYNEYSSLFLMIANLLATMLVSQYFMPSYNSRLSLAAFVSCLNAELKGISAFSFHPDDKLVGGTLPPPILCVLDNSACIKGNITLSTDELRDTLRLAAKSLQIKYRSFFNFIEGKDYDLEIIDCYGSVNNSKDHAVKLASTLKESLECYADRRIQLNKLTRLEPLIGKPLKIQSKIGENGSAWSFTVYLNPTYAAKLSAHSKASKLLQNTIQNGEILLNESEPNITFSTLSLPSLTLILSAYIDDAKQNNSDGMLEGFLDSDFDQSDSFFVKAKKRTGPCQITLESSQSEESVSSRSPKKSDEQFQWRDLFGGNEVDITTFPNKFLKIRKSNNMTMVLCWDEENLNSETAEKRSDLDKLKGVFDRQAKDGLALLKTGSSHKVYELRCPVNCNGRVICIDVSAENETPFLLATDFKTHATLNDHMAAIVQRALARAPLVTQQMYGDAHEMLATELTPS